MAELLLQTPSQTVGPFFHHGLAWAAGARLFAADEPGERAIVQIEVVDGAGAVLPDALLEFWQCDAAGRFRGPVAGGCAGFGRAATDADGRVLLDTVRPGRPRNASAEARTAPHIAVGVQARGLLRRLATRLYFEGDAALADDALLVALPPARHDTLIARRTGDDRWRWRIALQGDAETVFLDV